MKIETTNRDDHQAQLTAEFEPAVLEKYMHQAARRISREAKIPGFRPGKAPYDVIRRIYGDDAIRQQAIELMIDEVYPEVLKEAGVDPAGPGQLDDIVSMDPPVFKFLVPLAPEVTLGDYRSIHKEYSPKQITDEDVETVIQNLLRRSATAEPVEQPAQEGNLVYLKLRASYAEAAEGEDAEFIHETPYQVVIGEDASEENAWPYVNFSKELVGLAAGEEKTVEYTYPDETQYEKLRGRKVVFVINVQSIKSLELPELNEEFAQSMGEFETVEDLRNGIREQLQANTNQEYDEDYVSGIIDEIVEQSSVKYPPNMLEDEVNHVLEHLEQDLAQQKMDLPTYLKTRNLEREEFIEQEVKPAAVKRLQRSLVMNELTKSEDIHLDAALLESKVQQRMMEIQSSPYFAKKPTQAQLRDLANAITYDSANQMINDRIVRRLKSIASGLPEEPEVEEPTEEPVLTAGEEAVSVHQTAVPETGEVETAEEVTTEPDNTEEDNQAKAETGQNE